MYRYSAISYHSSCPRVQLFARTVTPRCARVLFIDDQIQLRRLGQGFVRSNDIVRTLAGLGCHVTVYALFPGQARVVAVYADMPDTVEATHDRALAGLEEFLKARLGHRDTIWIRRTHNLDRVNPIWSGAAPTCWRACGSCWIPMRSPRCARRPATS